jgi:hypothetical protein
VRNPIALAKSLNVGAPAMELMAQS